MSTLEPWRLPGSAIELRPTVSGQRKVSEGYCYIRPDEQWVNLGFYRGSSLPDPDGLLEGTGAAMRHIEVRTAEDADRPSIRRMVEAALDERCRALGG